MNSTVSSQYCRIRSCLCHHHRYHTNHFKYTQNRKAPVFPCNNLHCYIFQSTPALNLLCVKTSFRPHWALSLYCPFIHAGFNSVIGIIFMPSTDILICKLDKRHRHFVLLRTIKIMMYTHAWYTLINI